MKKYFLLLITGLFAALNLLTHNSCHLPVVEACDLEADFSITNDPASLSCPDSCEVFFRNDSKKVAGLSYSWNFGDGASSTLESPSHRFPPGEHFVELTVTLGDCVDKFDTSFTILDGGPFASFIVEPHKGFASDTVVLTNTSQRVDGYNFHWESGYNNETRTTADPNATVTFIYPVAGTYTVKMTAIASDGSGSSSTAAPVEVVVKVKTFKGVKFTVDSDDGNFESIFGIDQIASGGYFVVINNIKSCFLVTTDEAGNNAVPTEANLGPAYLSTTVSNFKKVSNGYLVTGRTSTSSYTGMYGLKVSNFFTVAKNKDLHDNTAGGNDFGYNATETGDEKYLFCGQAQHTAKQGMYFVKTQPGSLDPILPNTYLFTDEPDALATAVLNDSAGFLVAGKKMNSGTLEACFFHLTDNLTLSGQVSFWGAPDFEIKEILPLDNDRYALVGNDNGVARIRVVKPDGTFIWDEDFQGWSLGQVLYTSDKRMIMAGGVVINGIGKAGWLEINPQSGSKIEPFQTHLPAGLSFATATCIASTKDGGFVLGGYGEGGSKTWNIIIKTDQNGKIE
ncbi:MAG: PKD domain-containing protein [Saprospiraceae bacterium]|nr:PKD domain-containing protein [Saprospiraceae bacterium]